MKKLLALLLSLTFVFACFAGCQKDNEETPGGSSSIVDTGDSSTGGGGSSTGSSGEDYGYTPPPEGVSYTFSDYTALSPSNWNELTYQDDNDTQIMSFIGSPLFEYDFKFDEDGEIIPGDFDIEYSFATSLTDVSEEYGYEAGSAMAWAIGIRDDGKWDDGTPIVAGDFVYTMKQQLDPLFKNYRADSFYNGATVIKNARAYVFQGETEAVVDNEDVAFIKTKADLLKGDDGVYTYGDYQIAFAIKTGCTWTGGDPLADYAGEGYLNEEALAQIVELCDEDGYVQITDETIALLGTVINMEAWNETADDWYHYIHIFNYVNPKMDFSEVGIEALDDTTIVLQLEQPLQLTNPDGTPSYKAAYNMASLPLVKESLYETCKIAPAEGSTLWTSNYNSSVATTASWGPYKLTEFQAGKIYKLEHNPYWYGWNMAKYQGQYQTTHVVCETIGEWNTAWMKFLAGDLNAIGIDVSVAQDYKNSLQAYFTPDDFVSSLQLQSSADALRERESEGINKTILIQEDFRKALSLGIDRASYAATCTTASMAGLGLFNSMHYYDVEHGGVYRETDVAKRVLCNVYGVNPDEYPTLDDAVDAITGFDLTLARQLVDSAYDKAIAAGDLKETDKVLLTYGSSVDNEVTRRYFDNLVLQWNLLMEGTKLEGKFELEFNASFGTTWAESFRAGAYDICQGGWSGAAWDPGYFLAAYLHPVNMYSQAWDTTKEMLEFTLRGVNADGVPTNNPEDTFTANLGALVWWTYLNSNWQSGVLNEEFRLELIAALEQVVLTKYYSVPIMNSFGASLMSFKTDYITYEYNTFMGYGGIQYLTYNYNDAEWAAYVAENAVNGELNYK